MAPVVQIPGWVPIQAEAAQVLGEEEKSELWLHYSKSDLYWKLSMNHPPAFVPRNYDKGWPEPDMRYRKWILQPLHSVQYNAQGSFLYPSCIPDDDLLGQFAAVKDRLSLQDHTPSSESSPDNNNSTPHRLYRDFVFSCNFHLQMIFAKMDNGYCPEELLYTKILIRIQK